MTIRIQQQVRRLDVAVDHARGMEVDEGFEELVGHIPLMDVFQEISSYDGFQIRLHVLEDEVDVVARLTFNNMSESDNIYVASQS